MCLPVMRVAEAKLRASLGSHSPPTCFHHFKISLYNVRQKEVHVEKWNKHFYINDKLLSKVMSSCID